VSARDFLRALTRICLEMGEPYSSAIKTVLDVVARLHPNLIRGAERRAVLATATREELIAALARSEGPEA
jgi:hypothetical protein